MIIFLDQRKRMKPLCVFFSNLTNDQFATILLAHESHPLKNQLSIVLDINESNVLVVVDHNLFIVLDPTQNRKLSPSVKSIESLIHNLILISNQKQIQEFAKAHAQNTGLELGYLVFLQNKIIQNSSNEALSIKFDNKTQFGFTFFNFNEFDQCKVYVHNQTTDEKPFLLMELSNSSEIHIIDSKKLKEKLTHFVPIKNYGINPACPYPNRGMCKNFILWSSDETFDVAMIHKLSQRDFVTDDQLPPESKMQDVSKILNHLHGKVSLTLLPIAIQKIHSSFSESRISNFVKNGYPLIFVDRDCRTLRHCLNRVLELGDTIDDVKKTYTTNNQIAFQCGSLNQPDLSQKTINLLTKIITDYSFVEHTINGGILIKLKQIDKNNDQTIDRTIENIPKYYDPLNRKHIDENFYLLKN